MGLSKTKSLVVEKAIAHFRGDMSVGLYPHTVVVSGLDFRRDFFNDDAEGEKEFKDSLDSFRLHLQNALEALHSEKYNVRFDYEETEDPRPFKVKPR